MQPQTVWCCSMAQIAKLSSSTHEKYWSDFITNKMNILIANSGECCGCSNQVQLEDMCLDYSFHEFNLNTKRVTVGGLI